jgi:hypothetical protein
VYIRKEDEEKKRFLFLEVCPLPATQTTTHAEDISISGVHSILYTRTHTYIRARRSTLSFVVFLSILASRALAQQQKPSKKRQQQRQQYKIGLCAVSINN